MNSSSQARLSAATLAEKGRPLGVWPWVEVACATLGVYALLLGTGGLLLGRPAFGWTGLSLGLATLLVGVLAGSGRPRPIVT